MVDNSIILPVLLPADIQHAASLIEAAYTPGNTSEQQRQLQQELFEVQKKPEAWGLVIPFLEHDNPNVQFFGAHTAQVKIARDWDAIYLDEESKSKLKDVMLDITTKAVALRKSKVILRKLFVAISSLALRLVPGSPTKWPEWILSCVTMLSGRGANAEYILDFLSIVAEEVNTSDLVGPSKAQIQQTLLDAAPIVIQALTRSITNDSASELELNSAFKCLENWITVFRADEVVAFIPILIGLLSSETTFTGASDVLQEILTSSFLSDGSGTKSITEPLLLYFNGPGSTILQQTLASGSVDETSHSLCKLLVALGEHSISYIAAHLSHQLVQNFLKMMLSYTSLPGWYGVDEEESETTLSFWYLLQESLWTVDYVADRTSEEEGQWAIANALYTELSLALRRKITWPGEATLATWTKDQKDKFQVYRRDVGDTLLNAYYVLRDDQLKLYLDELSQLFSISDSSNTWEAIEANLYCLSSAQEAVPISDNKYLSILFSGDILGRLPLTGRHRVRRTAINLIGSYASWFTTQKDSTLLLSVVNHVATALGEPWLCLQAADALQKLCDANRSALATHIGAFGQLHANIPNIPAAEQTKVLESIASVIEALPPEQQIQPTEAIVDPIVLKLAEALTSSNNLPDEARIVAIEQLQLLTGCAKGLTGTADALLSLDDDDDEARDRELLRRARENPNMIRIREAILQSIRGVMELWSNDATTSDALSDLFKAITALPNDMTLISLTPGPLLQLVCSAAQRQLSSVWLSLASKLIFQLNPSLDLFNVKRAESSPESEAILLSVLPILLQTALAFFNLPNMMTENSDIVQEFFGCMNQITQYFPAVYFRLPPGAMDALLQAAVRALSLQERYSLVAAASFLGTFIDQTLREESATKDYRAQSLSLIQSHGESILRAVLFGVAGLAPASTNPNMVELLAIFARRCPAECKTWVPAILFSDNFLPTKASKADKEKFMKAILSGPRAIKRSAQDFTLVSKGLSGSGFGYASVTM